MKQVLQNLGNGRTVVEEVPVPAVRPGHLLIRSRVSLVSAGTERMLVEFGKANLIEKARQQPEKVRQTIDKARTEGVAATIEAVRAKLDQPVPMGYSNVGEVVEVGPGVTGFAVGDRVVSNGHHAELVCVPKNLCAKIPSQVDDETAAFTVLGAIALQGIRIAQPTLGETFAVSGLGLIGLMAVQLLQANGCRVLGLDFDRDRLALAEQFGAQPVDLSTGADPVAAARSFSHGRGVDGVIIAASTDSNDPVHQAAHMCRKRGRIVLTGVTGLELQRSDFYEKELSFQVSCSYGPGRYDPNYEDKGHDYPIGFVRWTEQRNFEAVLDMMAAGRIVIAPLISHRQPIDAAASVYERLSAADGLGVLFVFPDACDGSGERSARTVRLTAPTAKAAAVSLGLIGAGNYARRVLVPAFKKAGARLKTVVSAGGVSGTHLGKTAGFEITSTDVSAVMEDDDINLVVIATRHDSHARFVLDALKGGKHVFVEKPLALVAEDLDQIEAAWATAGTQDDKPVLMVGFNLRFSPHVVKARELLARKSAPKSMIMTVNAGAVPEDSWIQDPARGGGRIIGEACHFVDLARYLAGAAVTGVTTTGLAAVPCHDVASINLSFADGSMAAIHYFANGHRTFPKERLEVFQDGSILQIDNFRTLRAYGIAGFSRLRTRSIDKGQEACVARVVDSITAGGAAPIDIEELLEVSRATISAWSDLEGRA